MSRATKVLAGTTVLGFLASIWLYLDNQSLREEVAEKTEVIAKAEAKPAAPPAPDESFEEKQARDGKFVAPTPQPALPELKKEHRLDRRVRRGEEFAAMFGRLEGETEEQWRERVAPLIAAGMMRVRMRTQDNRREAEARAGVTPEQSAKIDQQMDKIYADVLDYTNRAIKDGQLSPYERNVVGWLDFAGGLGGILNDAQGSIGKVLSPEQMRQMHAAGFEWGEYIGAQMPWEKVTAPPPRN